MSNKKVNITDDFPQLIFDNEYPGKLISKAYLNAIDNLVSINTVECTKEIYNKTGLISYPPGLMIRAGGYYEQPWTRDASINAWNAASLLMPDVARNTLWAVCRRLDDGRITVQNDNQWWDKVIWITAAWEHYKITGDMCFLQNAYEASMSTLEEMYSSRFNLEFELFSGPSFFNDGISGYPEPPFNPDNTSSFVLNHQDTDKIMSLSTNCVYYNAYICTAEMAGALGIDNEIIDELRTVAFKLKNSINKYLWRKEQGIYGYFIHGDGELKGCCNNSQEGMGLVFAVLFGVADAEQTAQIFTNAHTQPKGITDIWPHFSRYNDEQPGRHNNIVWPLINGIWAYSAAVNNRADIFERELLNLAVLTNESDGIFYEIYNSITGKIDGGWQSGRHWESRIHQTWSATAFICAIYRGLFGMKFEENGIAFNPNLPAGWGTVHLKNIKYRRLNFNITVTGSGNKISKFLVDGKEEAVAFLASNTTNICDILIVLENKT